MSLVCAFFVICIHFPPLGGEVGSGAWWVGQFFNQGICCIAVPFFFIVSGYLLAGHCCEVNWWKRALSKRLRTIILPFFIWSILYAIYATLRLLLANIIEGNPLTTELPITGHDLLWILGLLPDKHPFLTPLWFLQGLFIFILIAPILVWIIRRGKTASSFFLLVLALIFTTNHLFTGGQGILWMLTHSVWFCIGLHLSFYPIQWKARCNLPLIVGILGASLLVLSIISNFYGWHSGIYLSKLQIPFTLYCFWGLFSEKPWKHTLVQASFPIFLTHMFFLSLLRAACIRLPFIDVAPISLPLLSCGLSFLLSLITSHVLHRYFPRTAALLFGGR